MTKTSKPSKPSRPAEPRLTLEEVAQLLALRDGLIFTSDRGLVRKAHDEAVSLPELARLWEIHDALQDGEERNALRRTLQVAMDRSPAGKRGCQSRSAAKVQEDYKKELQRQLFGFVYADVKANAKAAAVMDRVLYVAGQVESRGAWTVHDAAFDDLLRSIDEDRPDECEDGAADDARPVEPDGGRGDNTGMSLTTVERLSTRPPMTHLPDGLRAELIRRALGAEAGALGIVITAWEGRITAWYAATDVAGESRPPDTFNASERAGDSELPKGSWYADLIAEERPGADGHRVRPDNVSKAGNRRRSVETVSPTSARRRA